MVAKNKITKASFRKIVYDFYKSHKRQLPWRVGVSKRTYPYVVLVSEFMLQQTQVDRVIPKFQAFIKRFPTILKLAQARQSEVVSLWSGLGYNRRALYLHKAAQYIVEKNNGRIPREKELLKTIPGIGQYTASAIRIFAFNIPDVCIETNIRTVYIHHFFLNKINVSDTEIGKLVDTTLDTTHSREWFWALMDYGSYIKKTKGNFSKKSIAYKKQKPFKGSQREIRGAIIKLFTKTDLRDAKKSVIIRKLNIFDKYRIEIELKNLIKEGFLVSKGGSIYLK